MKRAVLLCAVMALAAFTPLSVGAAESRPLPDDVLILAEMANPGTFEQKLHQLVARLAPGAPMESLQGGLAIWARTDDPTLLNLSAPLQWAVCHGEDPAKPVFVFSVIDGARYLDSLSANLQGGKVDGNLHLFEEDQIAGAGEGAWDARPAQPLAIAVLGSRVVLGRSAEGVRKVAALVEAGALGSGPFFAGADAGGAARVHELVGVLAEQGKDPFALVKSRMAGVTMAMPPQGQAGIRMFQMVIDGAESATKEMEVLTVAVSLTPQAIVCMTGVQAVEGGALAAHLATMQGGRQELLACMPAGAAAVVAGHVGDPALLLDLHTKLMSRMAPEDGSAADALARIKAKTAEMMGLSDGRFASAVIVAPGGTLASAKAYGVNDPVRVGEVANSMGALVEDLATLQTNMGSPFVTRVTVSPNALTHAGHPITAWDYKMEFHAPDATMPGAEQIAAMQKGLITSIVGNDMKAFSAVREDALVTYQGAGALDALKALLDGKMAPVTGAPRFVAAMAGMPEKPVVVGYVALGDVAGVYLQAMSKAMQGSGMPFPPLSNIRFAEAPAVAFAAAVDGKELETRLVIPVDAISSIANGFMQAFMGAGMGGGPGMMP